MNAVMNTFEDKKNSEERIHISNLKKGDYIEGVTYTFSEPTKYLGKPGLEAVNATLVGWVISEPDTHQSIFDVVIKLDRKNCTAYPEFWDMLDKDEYYNAVYNTGIHSGESFITRL